LSEQAAEKVIGMNSVHILSTLTNYPIPDYEQVVILVVINAAITALAIRLCFNGDTLTLHRQSLDGDLKALREALCYGGVYFF
jgi:hypothetical protein